MSTLPDYVDALTRALESVRPLDATEDVGFTDAAGRVLAMPIIADRDLPPFDRAQMDGYALRAAEVGVIESWPVVTMIAAGRPADVRVPPGHCVAIATGAPLPDDVDTVIQHERSDRGDPVRFTVTAVEPGQAVHLRGADARRGDVLVEAGAELRAMHVGIAAAVGAERLTVRCRPRVCILSSGDEVLPVGVAVAIHQIRNSNGPMVTELLRRCGAGPIDNVHVRDEPAATIDAVDAALQRADLVVTVGGISAGERDHFPEAFDHHGVTRSLVGAAIQPGKPVVVGRAPGGAVVLGLPGNPVSSLACTCLFGWPIVRRLLGLTPDLAWRETILAAPVTPNARRRAFRPAALDAAGRVTVPRWAGSGDLAHTAKTDGLAELPVRAEPLAPGERVRFLAWP